MRAHISHNLAARCLIGVGIFAGLAAATAAMQPPDVNTDGPTDRDAQPDRRRLVSNPVPSIASLDRLLNRFVTTEDAREASLARRAQTRAFAGAPPVVPHQLQGTTLTDCVSCHESGKRSGRQLARKMSHTILVACMQCHVEQANSEFGELPSLGASSFEGLRPKGIAGSRGYEGTPPPPPFVPHQTLMRTNCNSCHGTYGYEGFRTDHPERLNCVQCHAISAEFDQLAPTFNLPSGEW